MLVAVVTHGEAIVIMTILVITPRSVYRVLYRDVSTFRLKLVSLLSSVILVKSVPVLSGLPGHLNWDGGVVPQSNK